MIDPQLFDRFKVVSTKRETRLKLGKWLLENPNRIEKLLVSNFPDELLAMQAFWGLDMAVEIEPLCILESLEDYQKHLERYKHHSIIRTLSRINYNFLEAIYVGNANKIALNDNHKSNFIDYSFKVLLSNNSIAASVFAISSLRHFAREKQWVKDELLYFIESYYQHSSKGFQARARMVLKDLKKG